MIAIVIPVTCASARFTGDGPLSTSSAVTTANAATTATPAAAILLMNLKFQSSRTCVRSVLFLTPYRYRLSP